MACNASVRQPSWSGYSGTVKVSMFWCWHLPHQHKTGADDGEGNIPKADTRNDWEAINWVSTWWGIMRRDQQFETWSNPKVTRPGTRLTGTPFKSSWVSGSTVRIDMPRWLGKGVGGGSVQGWRGGKLGSHKGNKAQTPQQSPSRSLYRRTPLRELKNIEN